MTDDRAPARPITGTAAGVPYLALPPATGPDPAPLVLGLHAFEPPRSEAALAGALPMASLPAWRVYLGLPLFGARLPEGGVAEINRRGERDYLVELFGPVVEEAAAELTRAETELRSTLPITESSTGLVGVGAGGAAALLALAEDRLPVGAAAVVNPVLDPAPVLATREQRTGEPYTWHEQARRTRTWLDFPDRAPEVARNHTPLLMVNGGRDEVITPRTGQHMHEALRPWMPEHALHHIVVPDLAHVIGPEPGLRPPPPTPAGVLADRALTEWFHRFLTISPQVRAQSGT